MKPFFTLYLLVFSIGLNAAVFNSSGASTNWSSAVAWTLMSGTDSDGIPDTDDDVVILNGHTVGFSTTSYAKTLTINVGGNLTTNNKYIGMRGSFSNSGTVIGNLYFTWVSSSSSISSTTPLTISILSLVNNSTLNITSGTVLSFTQFEIRNGSKVNNSGTVTATTLTTLGTTGTLNNLSGSSFILLSNLPYAITITNNSNSTFTLNKNVTNIPLTVAYGNLVLTGSTSTKAPSAALTINGNLTIASGVTLNLASNTLNLRGDLNNSGTVSNAATVNLNGTTDQTLTSSSAISIPTLSASNTNTIILSTGSYSLTAAATFAGNLTVNAVATLNMNSITLNLAGNLSNSGTISNISTINLNGTSNQTLATTPALSIPNLNSSNVNTVILSSGTYNITTGVSLNSSLTINAGAVLNMNSITLSLQKDLSNSGTISNLLDLTLNGTTAQSVSSTQSLTIEDLTTSNASGVAFTAGTYTVSNSITVSSGNLNAGSNLMTLQSDATKTAYIANSAGTISGSMIIQRYVSARAANYHDFSSPVTNTTINDWDDELFMSIGAPNDVPGYQGGDGSSAGFNSVYIYDNAIGDYQTVSTGTTLQVGKGYQIFVGDNLSTFPGRAIDSRGTPNMGTQNPSISFGTDGYNLVGNPHASYIEWSSVLAASTNMDATIQMLDNSGQYIDYAGSVEIPAGQGFFVYANSGASILSIPQSAKTTTTNSNFNRLATTKNYDLKLRFSSSMNPYYHQTKISYDNKGTAGFDKGRDITFIPSKHNTAPALVFVDGNVKTINNHINTNNETVIMPLLITTPIEGNYVIELEGLFSSEGYSSAYILDNLTNKQYPINDGESVTLYFENTTHDNFSLVLSKKASVATSVMADYSENASIFATSDFINVKSNFTQSEEITIQVYNTIGQLVVEQHEVIAPNSTVNLSTSSLNADVYIVKVTTNSGKQFTNRVVVAK